MLPIPEQLPHDIGILEVAEVSFWPLPALRNESESVRQLRADVVVLAVDVGQCGYGGQLPAADGGEHMREVEIEDVLVRRPHRVEIEFDAREGSGDLGAPERIESDDRPEAVGHDI